MTLHLNTFELGIVSAGTGSTTEDPVIPPPPNSTVIVRITSPTFKIQEVGSSVNFSCQAQSVMTTQRLPITWTKVGGPLPQGRSQVDNWSGILLITNLQMSDSGKYICETMDGVSTAQAIATLKVPGEYLRDFEKNATIDMCFYYNSNVHLR